MSDDLSDDEVPSLDGSRWIAFELGGESFAAPLLSVREVLRPSPLTEVPRGPRGVLGVALVHGEVLTVFDLGPRLGVGPAVRGPSSRLLLVQLDEEPCALWVDQVRRIYTLTPAQIEPTQALGLRAGPHVLGVGRVGREGRPVTLLDPVLLLRG